MMERQDAIIFKNYPYREFSRENVFAIPIGERHQGPPERISP
jgi:hypothetical protein